ncbi:MAG: hypothetical protein KIH69_017045 [Anaerolineae bacterium]|nr:hypothetical protein [Anaerolineae bacterium]
MTNIIGLYPYFYHKTLNLALYNHLMLDLIFWVLLYVVFPLSCGGLIALPLWLRRKIMIGNVIGSVVIALIMVVLVMRAYGNFVGDQDACRQSNYESVVCNQDSMDVIYTMFGLVGVSWLDVFGLFALSGVVEDSQRRRNINPDMF